MAESLETGSLFYVFVCIKVLVENFLHLRGLSMEFKGIDVSSYQGKPDWKKVKAAGIQIGRAHV